jgi:hypothetical protein
MTEVANRRRNASWKRVVRLHAAQGLAERAPRVREMAVRPVDVDGRDKPWDKPGHDGEGHGFPRPFDTRVGMWGLRSQ